MRTVIVSAMVSMDGVMQAPGGPEEDTTGGFKFGGWTAPLGDTESGREILALFDKPFDLLLGRRTYDIFAAYWPHHEGSAVDAIAKAFNKATKYVATRKGVALSWKTSVALRDAAKDVANLKKGNGPPLLTQGSADLVHTLLTAGLVDELHTFTFPVMLGKGKRLFADDAQPRTFELTHSAVSPTGIIHAVYKRGGDVKTGTVGEVEEAFTAPARRRTRKTKG